MSTKGGAAEVAFLIMAQLVEAQTVQWNFGGSEANPWPSSDDVDFVSGDSVTNGNTSVAGIDEASNSKGGYDGASGTYNAYATAKPGDLATGVDGSSFLGFSLRPSVGYTLVATNLAFGMRSTSTGPRAFCVRCSLDDFASDWGTGTNACDGDWHWKSLPLAVTSVVAGATVSVRIYGYGGSGSGTGNWRVDDLTVAVHARTTWDATPPDLAQVMPQRVRVGQTLRFALEVTPTEGDPVTYTNVEASAGAAGAYSLNDGIFTYAPADADFGAQAFVFSVADKDGTNSMTTLVSVLRRQVEAIRIASASGIYVQDFDALAASGTANEWDNSSYPFVGWYAYADATAVTTYRAGVGSETAGGLYSYGVSSTNADRSLGSLASGGNDYRYGVAFTNETGLALTNVTVSFTAEQWHVGANARTNSLAFEYCVTNRALPLTQGVWRRVRMQGFETPAVTNADQSAGAGYWSTNTTAVLGCPVPADAVLLLRWCDVDDAGNDHGFGIDDLSVVWSAGTLPGAIPVLAGGASETFDEMNTNAVADLPFLWRIESRDDAPRVTGAYADALPHSALANAALSSSCGGGYNFSSREFGDQAVGGLSSGTAGKSVTLFGKFANAAGVPIRRWSVAYNVEKYRNGVVGTAVRLLASIDGETWTAVGEPTAFAADADTNGYTADACPGTTVAAAHQVIFTAPITNGGVFYLAWQISATSGDTTEGAQALGVDDVRILPEYSSGATMLVR